MYIPIASGQIPTAPPAPDLMFVWNKFLLDPCINKIHREFHIHIIYGFVAQNHISVFGRAMYVTLIARRSRYVT